MLTLLMQPPVEAPTPTPPMLDAVDWRQEAEELKAELSAQREENERLRDEIERLKATQWRSFTATAYTADCAEGCTGITATGVDVRNRTHVDGLRVIAVDTAVIPLGTTVELRFGDGSTERAVALDTGGAIDGAKLDYLVSDTATALQFGRQRVDIRIIKEAV